MTEPLKINGTPIVWVPELLAAVESTPTPAIGPGSPLTDAELGAVECWGGPHDFGVRVAAEVRRLRAQLPDGMKRCAILFKECPKGHGWLTAANWVQYGCPTCERDALRAQVVDERRMWQRMVRNHCCGRRCEGCEGAVLQASSFPPPGGDAMTEELAAALAAELVKKFRSLPCQKDRVLRALIRNTLYGATRPAVCDTWAAAIRKAVAAEREACAQLVMDWHNNPDYSHDSWEWCSCEGMAAAIRARP